jgi:hypothetical protein
MEQVHNVMEIKRIIQFVLEEEVHGFLQEIVNLVEQLQQSTVLLHQKEDIVNNESVISEVLESIENVVMFKAVKVNLGLNLGKVLLVVELQNGLSQINMFGNHNLIIQVNLVTFLVNQGRLLGIGLQVDGHKLLWDKGFASLQILR